MPHIQAFVQKMAIDCQRMPGKATGDLREGTMKIKSIIGGLILSAACLSIAQAAVVDVNVDSQAGPWLQVVNPTSDYGIGDNFGPTLVSVTAGSTLTITYLGGLTDAFGNAPSADATGHPGFDASNNPGSTSTRFPSFYADPSTYPIFLNALIGAFADSSGVLVPVGGFNAFAPFAADSSIPFSIVVPVGATELQLGVNDDFFADNVGSLQIRIDGADAPVAVPGPVVGAGLPGLIMAGGALLALRRRKQNQLAA